MKNLKVFSFLILMPYPEIIVVKDRRITSLLENLVSLEYRRMGHEVKKYALKLNSAKQTR
ncbi:MAG: hypothetical protein DRJ67_05435 [Thermoprotei archaeon]|nr:MAG: hypothetical protein DRJ67_05435 [Thermoprotei archaeon]